MSTLTIRPFSACVEALRRSQPDATLNHADRDLEHYDSAEAYSHDPIGAWADDPPLSVLYRQKDPSAAYLKDPKAFVDYCNFGGAVATWNANGEGRWKHGEGWIVVDVELTQEQAESDCGGCEGASGDYVSVVFAMWKVEEGYAAAVWEPGDHGTLALLMGFDPFATSDGWASCSVWYGE